jgi:serine phosphatase RsbU (regulator of sigma subunit)
MLIFVWRAFPTMYVDDVGLTPLKIIAEYLIVLLTAVALWMLRRDSTRFEPRVATLLAGSMLMMILAELAFTLYVDVYGALNFLGHFLALSGLMMVYSAIIDTALVRPFNLIFLELQQLVEAEHDIADKLQSAMLTAPPSVGCLEMATAYASAEGLARVGGDFYDLFEPVSGSAAFVVGDVCGKGIEAATSTSMVRTTLRSFAYGSEGPRKVLSQANDSLSHQFASDKFATVIYGVVDAENGMLRIGSAGHPNPVLCRSGSAAELAIPPNPPLSVIAGHEFDMTNVQLHDGDNLILFTDGLLDAGWRVEAFGPERVLAVVRRSSHKPPKQIADALMTAVELHAGSALDDDVAIVVLRYTANTTAPSA